MLMFMRFNTHSCNNSKWKRVIIVNRISNQTKHANICAHTLAFAHERLTKQYSDHITYMSKINSDRCTNDHHPVHPIVVVPMYILEFSYEFGLLWSPLTIDEKKNTHTHNNQRIQNRLLINYHSNNNTQIDN